MKCLELRVLFSIRIMRGIGPILLYMCKGACWWQESQAQVIELGINGSSLISAQKLRKPKYKTQKTSGYKTRRTPEHYLHNAYKQTFTDKDNEGEQRVKYTTCNEWD
jgi:hypothetical protein